MERRGNTAGWRKQVGVTFSPYGVKGKHDGCRKEVPLRRFESDYGDNIQYSFFIFFSVREDRHF